MWHCRIIVWTMCQQYFNNISTIFQQYFNNISTLPRYVLQLWSVVTTLVRLLFGQYRIVTETCRAALCSIKVFFFVNKGLLFSSRVLLFGQRQMQMQTQMQNCCTCSILGTCATAQEVATSKLPQMTNTNKKLKHKHKYKHKHKCKIVALFQT